MSFMYDLNLVLFFNVVVLNDDITVMMMMMMMMLLLLLLMMIMMCLICAVFQYWFTIRHEMFLFSYASFVPVNLFLYNYIVSK